MPSSRLSSLLVAVPVLCASVGCEIGDDWEDDDPYDWHGPAVCGTSVGSSTIDADAPLEAEPGSGVGVFVEYQAGGRWYVFTTCDTDVSDYDCLFDIVATPLGSAVVEGVHPDSVEREDSLDLTGQDSVRFVGYTSTDTDGFYLDTEPGRVLELDVLLDGECGNAYLYWVGDGAIHQGAPSNPFELEPIEP